MMKLYVHERQLDESRRLFGSIYAKAGAKLKADDEPSDDAGELTVTLASCSKAYLAGNRTPTQMPTRAGSLSRDERGRLIWAYNRDRWNRRTR